MSSIIYHNSQKQFVTDLVNKILNNIINETSSDCNTGNIVL